MGGDDLIKMHEFNDWRCDSCGEFITSIEGGWVEWLASESDRGQEVLRGLRLVHRGSIRPNGKKVAATTRLRNSETAKQSWRACHWSVLWDPMAS
jgi:hypothetical protein